ncbi:MAG: FtsQ-type POTRA domain-containing protein [Clostridia bacterium]|nr:FtsQ-type POTRA domain-containing protein [Clostridia bacterium]
MASKINKQEQIEVKKRKRRKIIVIALVIMSIFIGISAYVLTADVFNIQDIEIEGNKGLTQEKIYELSGIRLGDNIFSKFNIVTKVKLKECGYIEDVIVKKLYPNKMKIEVKERKPQYQIQTEDGGYIYIDGQGYILEYSLEKLEIQTIIGMEITQEKIQDTKRLEEIDLERLENILQIKAETDKIDLSSKITKINVQEEYILYLENDGININIGDATNLKNRMYYVKAIMAKEAGNTGTIYVNGNLDEGYTPYFSTN